MTIREEDYIMEESQFASALYDLQLLAPTVDKSGTPVMKMKDAGYGLTLDRCAKLIINNRINNNIKGDVSIAGYVNAYIAESKKLRKQLSI